MSIFTHTAVQISENATSYIADEVTTRVVYSRVLNGSVKGCASIEGKQGRVQVTKSGSVNITGRFSNAEMAAMFEAILASA